MIKINRLTDYSLVLLDALDTDKSNCTSAKCLSLLTRVPLPTVSKVLKLLSAHDILIANRGPHGGYTLVVPLQELSLMQVMVAIEGELSLTACLGGEDCACEEVHCRMKPGWERLNHHIRKVLSQTMVADMIHSHEGVEQEQLVWFHPHEGHQRLNTQGESI